ncbi:NADPH-dependent oxidoreductase [Altererythrobacter confluentis]|uniref:NADPH-dependent oxidoreductase n=1 Tax=Allopontixanthobacter confluentis TaxID=1849021 RepID=A0A6L7GBJ7_9SPHN|nr:NAD(P)H-dependent oxidoreductase [Allopontixanthobacter confluentis]MXP13257.1 NADPH-dependent oxidoreductase [Allopontixanthobacter confluentis]
MIRIVALGGTPRVGSSTEKALALACRAAEVSGAQITHFNGEYMSSLPFYGGPGHSADAGADMVAAVRQADGILIASPGYHGSISGLVKNALDYIEDLSTDERPYLHGRPVGLIATSFGHQAAMSTLLTLRSITHALRGWPTPVGAAIRTTPETFDENGEIRDVGARMQLELVGQQVFGTAGKFL